MIHAAVEMRISEQRNLYATARAAAGFTAQILSGSVTLYDDSAAVAAGVNAAALTGFDPDPAATVRAWYFVRPAALSLTVDATYYLVFKLVMLAQGTSSTVEVNIQVKVIADSE